MSTEYWAQTGSDGITRIRERSSASIVGGRMLVFLLILAAVAVVAQVIFTSTGSNVLDVFDGITGPCGTCTTTPEGN